MLIALELQRNFVVQCYNWFNSSDGPHVSKFSFTVGELVIHSNCELSTTDKHVIQRTTTPILIGAPRRATKAGLIDDSILEWANDMSSNNFVRNPDSELNIEDILDSNKNVQAAENYETEWRHKINNLEAKQSMWEWTVYAMKILGAVGIPSATIALFCCTAARKRIFGLIMTVGRTLPFLGSLGKEKPSDLACSNNTTIPMDEMKMWIMNKEQLLRTDMSKLKRRMRKIERKIGTNDRLQMPISTD